MTTRVLTRVAAFGLSEKQSAHAACRAERRREARADERGAQRLRAQPARSQDKALQAASRAFSPGERRGGVYQHTELEVEDGAQAETSAGQACQAILASDDVVQEERAHPHQEQDEAAKRRYPSNHLLPRARETEVAVLDACDLGGRKWLGVAQCAQSLAVCRRRFRGAHAKLDF
ncbi:hypothetical protein T492DRAFT_836729 [Pavlovales sp. CCMP2436]|nr:hypothetical protein T492DRAFT_836729 [Pavlovales sp. CCMP2436]